MNEQALEAARLLRERYTEFKKTQKPFLVNTSISWWLPMLRTFDGSDKIWDINNIKFSGIILHNLEYLYKYNENSLIILTDNSC